MADTLPPVDPEQLERLLEAATETQTFEVKGAMKWDDKSLAKDILAFANVRDGGHIVIGVEDGTFARQGVDAEILASYQLDVMRDQMTKYADPHVDFSVSFPKDREGKQYVVIRVLSFREVPVICRKNSTDVREGAIYYRTTNRRPESAPINNSYDMRDLITTAAARMRDNFRRLGVDLTPVDSDWQRKLDSELGDL
jgi:predicted HTH transcriptional regulator